MKFISFVAFGALLVYAVIAEENSWSWGDDKQASSQKTEEISHVEEPQLAASEYIADAIQANSTEAEEIVEQILTSKREGRNVDGFDEVYSDPSVSEALQKGDEGEARNLIKERLCELGLMQCNGGIQEKRPYIAPEELIYAQPVAINPVGRPIPTIPVKGVRGSYGPPKPMPFPPNYRPNSNKFGPPLSPPALSPNKPPRRGYGPPFPPTKPFYGPPPPVNKPFLNEHEVFGGASFSQPIEPENPYEFDKGFSQTAHHKDKRVEVVVNAQGGAATASSGSSSGVQQHVHHHYHHNTEGGVNKVVVNPIPIASAAVVSTSSSIHETDSFNSAFKPSSSGFNPILSNYPSGGLTIGGSSGGSSGGLTIGGSSLGGSAGGFGSSLGGSSGGLTIGGSSFTGSGSTYGGSTYGGGTYGGQTIANYGSTSGLNQFATKPQLGPQTFGNSFGASVGSYGSSELYKKELNLQSVNSNYLQSYADKYQGLESARAENYDCVCVPYDQCPSHDVIGRKDDLYLPLDPRSLKSDIEALSDDQRVITDGNGTMTVVRVPKGASLNVTEIDSEVKAEDSTGEAKKVAKREAPQQDDKSKIEPRQYGNNYNTNNNNNNNKKIKPTFGISFGLPNQGGGGYPINPHGPNPYINPYGGTIGGQGINLGLVSVNPLFSLQLTKDDSGDKVVKPFVNLHVTPNSYLVNKFEDIFSHKKHVIFNKHKHYHYHKPHHHDYQHYPEIHHGPAPFYSEEPPSHYHGPIEYSPEYPEPSYVDHKPTYYDNPFNYGGFGHFDDHQFYGRAYQNDTNLVDGNSLLNQYQQQYDNGQNTYGNTYDQLDQSFEQFPQDTPNFRAGKTLFRSDSVSNPIKFPESRKRRDLTETQTNPVKRQAYYGRPQVCGPRHVCCRRPLRPQVPSNNYRQCGTRHSQGINGRIKNPVYVDGDSEFGEYPWQVAILKKDAKESVYVCGGTLIDPLHILTAAHCVKTYTGFDLRVRLGEWDVNHDVEFYPYIERDVTSVNVHPEFYAGTLYNDIAVLRMDKPVDWSKHPHISPACLPQIHDDYTGARCWTTGWGKDAFGDFGKYQNILKEVDVPIVNQGLCQRQLQQTRLGYDFKLHPGFICAGGEEGKDACKGDGGGPMVCERGGTWQVVGIVSWGIGCGQVGVPGVYVKVAHYLDWIRQITQRY